MAVKLASKPQTASLRKREAKEEECDDEKTIREAKGIW
jgi:hypothetical protein